MLTVPTTARPKTVIVQDLLDAADAQGQHLSVSQARRLAQRIRRGDYDPKVAESPQIISYADPTGERAVGNVLRQQKKNGPCAPSAKTRTGTVSPTDSNRNGRQNHV